jgi:superfamily II DNA or RNA helicase
MKDLDMRLKDYFDAGTVERGQDYARRGLVTSIDPLSADKFTSRVSNGRGESYQQRITISRGYVDGICSCPVGRNCKHVVAALIKWAERDTGTQHLAAPVQGWLNLVRHQATVTPAVEERPFDFPETVKDRLLYVLMPHDTQFRVDIYKGRINTAGTGLNKAIRRYDALHALHSTAAAKFIRPDDFTLLTALAQAGLWQTHYSYSLPDVLRPTGEDALALIRRLCDTGRFLYENAPDTYLHWSNHRPKARLAWRRYDDGSQKLEFEDADGAALALRALDGATLWVDFAQGQIGALAQPVPLVAQRLVASAPQVMPKDAAALAAELPTTLAGLDLPPPTVARQIRRNAHHRFARLTLGAGVARDGSSRWSDPITLPTLTLRFVYDGQEISEGDADPRFVENNDIVTLSRDLQWEDSCSSRLMAAGATPVEDLMSYWPSETMLQSDFVFAEGEMHHPQAKAITARDILDFAFRTLPELVAEGWQIIETPHWPYRLSEETPVLSVETQGAAGDAFQGNDWFSLGFQAEIGGKSVDVAPLIAAFLEQMRDEWDVLPDPQALAQHLAARPIYLDRGKAGYAALDLSPLAPLLHLVLNHYAELGALHPSDADVARLAEEALAGSAVRFSDNAGILPLARSLQALAAAENIAPPSGLRAELRPYQAYGSAWMASLLKAGFGGVLADDMGLGKTIQVLALLQARVQAAASGPALLVVPTSLLHGWQMQAAEFTPALRLVVLHGTGRTALREQAQSADLVITTYPLLTRDADWLEAMDWPLVILDEAQTLKNPTSQMAKTLRRIPAKGRLALTGTPLENSLQDLWTLVDWVNPGLLGDRKGFQTLFRTPIEKHGDAAAQARLNRRLRPFMLRRTKEQVATELPPKTEILERVELPKPQQALYETVRSTMDQRVREAISARGLAAARFTVLDALLKLRQVCCDPALVKTDAARTVADSAKRARLRELLTELVAEGRRVLVFSQFVEMLHLIEGDLTAAGIPHLTLTGQTRNRGDVLRDFAQGDAPVFLLSLKAGGVGLTLTEADTVILYDPWWNPAVERQAMDRTHRIGQDKPVFVHRLVAAGTVEEKILDMQARKQALADALFDTQADTVTPLLDEATLQDLFAPMRG